MEYLSVFLQKFLEIVLPVLATALAGLVVAWITKIVNQVKSKLSQDAQWYIEQAVTSAVLAAEQLNLAGKIEDKKDYALQVAEQWLAEKKIKIDLAKLSDLIEAEVMSQFNRDKVNPFPEYSDNVE